MFKHTQTIRQQKLTNCLSMFDHLVGLPLKGLNQFTQFVSSSITSENKKKQIFYQIKGLKKKTSGMNKGYWRLNATNNTKRQKFPKVFT